MVLRKTLRPQGTGVYVAKGVRAHLNPDDREGWGDVLSLFLRPFARLHWIVLVGLSVVVRPGTAQETRSPPAAAPARRVLNKPLNRFPAIVRRRGKRGSTAEECS